MSTRRAPASSPSQEKQDNGKVKLSRRQLVSCDSCRLRRVRCDREEGNEDEPCGRCTSKGIQCTSEYIVQRKRGAAEPLVRDGKRIAAARLLFGQSEQDSAMASSSGQTADDRTAKEHGNQLSPTSLPTPLDDLLRTFTEVVHPQMSDYIDWNGFLDVYYDVSSMDPSLERLKADVRALGLVCRAWSARFSDDRSMLPGPSSRDARLAAKLPSLDDFEPGLFAQFDFCLAGEKRNTIALGLQTRAQECITSELVSNPSSFSAQALLALELLVCWGKEDRSDGRHLLLLAIDHFKALHDGSQLSSRVDGGLLLALWRRDSVSSAFAHRLPMLTEDDLELFCPELAQLRVEGALEELVSATPLEPGAAVFALFCQLNDTFRDFCRRVAGPIPRKKRLDFGAVFDLWDAIERSSVATSTFADASAASGDANSHPYHYHELASMRVALTYAIHRHIEQRIDFEQRSRSRGAIGPDDTIYLNDLEEIRTESTFYFLSGTREIARQLAAHDLGVIFEAGIELEFLPVYAQHMLSVPCDEEEGGADSRWGQDWTLESKVRELGWMLRAMECQGFCWPGYRKHVEETRAATDHLENLPRYSRSNGTPPSPGLSPPPPPHHSHSASYHPPSAPRSSASSPSSIFTHRRQSIKPEHPTIVVSQPEPADRLRHLTEGSAPRQQIYRSASLSGVGGFSSRPAGMYRA